MFGIGLPELFMILALALIVLGPDKLPETARKIAKILTDLRRTTEEFKRELELEALDDLKELKRPDYFLDKLTVSPEQQVGQSRPERELEKEEPEKINNTIEPQFSNLGPGWKEAKPRNTQPESSDQPTSKGDSSKADVH